MSTNRMIGAIDGRGYGTVVTQPVPAPAPGQLLVRVRASLISPGTELGRCPGLRADPPAEPGDPIPFGYQNAGEVIGVGDGAGEFAVGDRVACMGGGYAMHTDFAVVPFRLCARLPDAVTYEQAAAAHLAITSLHALRRGKLELGENALVVGLGLVGQLAAMLARLAGAYVMGWDSNPFRVQLARDGGIHGTTLIGRDDPLETTADFTGGRGFDLAVMAFGGDGTKALQQVAQVMSRSPDGHEMGRICMVGGAITTAQWGAGLGNLNLLSCARTGAGYHDEDWEHGRHPDYAYPFMRWTTRTNLEFVLRLMGEGRLPVEQLITHRFPLERIADAVDALVERPTETLGTILTMND